MDQELKVSLELQPCCGNRTGIGTYAYELASRLQDGDGLKFFGNLFNFLGRNDNRQDLADITMPVHECRTVPYGVYRRIWNLVYIPYKNLFPDTDLHIFFNYIIPPRVEGKVMTTVHDMTYLRYPETMDRRNLRRLRRGMTSSVERSDHLLTVSEFSKGEIVELLGVPAERISVVPCAPSIYGESADFSFIAEKYKIRKPFLLYVGTIEPRKNLTRLLKAFQILKKEQGILHQLILAGGKGWANEEIYRSGSEIEDVLFTGYVARDEKYALFKNAEAFVFPSVYEGFGMPPLEAMHFGCPVVCSRAASLPEIVGDAAELVDPMDEYSIAEGIWNILSEKGRAAELSSRGRERATKYSWDVSAKTLRRICRRILEAS